jgi:NAD(P)-dependent dehydrogenase (short-subunit alcohol dehydrogenase family)
MDIQFSGKRALVTGGGRGIGKQIALLLNEMGAGVTVIDRIKEDLDALSKEINCKTINADISDASAARQAAEQAGNIDLLVNCAGIVVLQPFLETTVENFDESMAVNVRAAMIISQVVTRGMINRKQGGAVVNISSVASVIGLTDHLTYCISKAGVDELTRVMALELGPHNIRVNAIQPVTTMTPMAVKAWSDPKKKAWMLEKIPLGRFNEPIDVANAVAWLLCEKAAMVHGVLLPVDGGFLAI